MITAFPITLKRPSAVEIVPIVYLFLVTTLQLVLLQGCFNATVQITTIAAIFSGLGLFSLCYIIGIRTSAENKANVATSSSRALIVLATILAVASFCYIAIAVIRATTLWDIFSQGSTVTRAQLYRTRIGITPLGTLNSFFVGAPTVFCLFVAVFFERLRFKRIFLLLSCLSFMAFTLLISAEGGRISIIVATSCIGTAMLFRLIDSGLNKRRMLNAVTFGFVIAIAASIYTYNVAVKREALRALTETSESALSIYGRYIRIGSALDQQLQTDPDPSWMASRQNMSSFAVVSCYYFSQAPASIDRIISKGAKENLIGFFMMPNLHKVALLTGLAQTDWLFYSDFYAINGMYSGLLGVLLVDFYWFGFVFMGLFGFFSGRLLSNTIQNGFTSTAILTCTVPTLIVLIPIVDLVSTAQMQSMIPWGVFVILSLAFSLPHSRASALES